MERRIYRGRFFALIIGLLCLWTAEVTAAAGTNDPRAEKMALVIGYAMSHQHDRIETFPTVAKTPVLESVEGTVATPDFYLAGAYVLEFDIDQHQGRLAGLIYHRDGLSRIIMTRFEAAFQEAAKLQIMKVDLAPAYTPTPRSSLFFVPAERLSAMDIKNLSYKEALLQTNQNAIPATGQKADTAPKDYTVVAFMLDRQPPDVRMELAQGASSEDISDPPHHAGLNQDGWCYAVLPTRFAYNNGEEVVFNIILRKGSASWQANTYSSHSLLKRTQQALAQRGYDPGSADGLMGTRTRQAITQFQKRQGIAADGEPSMALLSLLRANGRPPGVQFAQVSLQHLGYDPGPTDGLMGRQTATAVRAYQADCGLVTDGLLSAELLCHLSALSGLPLRDPDGAAAVDSAPPNRFESRMWPNALGKP